MIQTATPTELMKLVYAVNNRLLGRARRSEMELMIGTTATEGGMVHRTQIGGGPARGLFQTEPATARDIYENMLTYPRYRHLYHRMMDIVFGLGSAPFFVPREAEIARLLMYDDYAACIARLCYYRQPSSIPETLEGQAAYYKQFYNTVAGAGSVKKYINDYRVLNCAALVDWVLAKEEK